MGFCVVRRGGLLHVFDCDFRVVTITCWSWFGFIVWWVYMCLLFILVFLWVGGFSLW